MNNRLKQLRKTLHLTQTEFAQRIGSVQNTITRYEKGDRIPSGAIILSICREFGVNEAWLRTGEGEMFAPHAPDLIETVARQYNLGFYGTQLLRTYLELSPANQQVIDRVIAQLTANVQAAEDALAAEDVQPSAPAAPQKDAAG